MDASDVVMVIHLGAAVVALLLIAGVGRRLAGVLRQPPVIGEIVAGLAAGPALVALVGSERGDLVLPDNVSSGLRVIGQAGLALYLVGVAHQLRTGPSGLATRTIGWTVAGALLAPLVLGALLGGWVDLTAGPALRGGATSVALILMLAVALSVTAVPVLARLIAEDAIGGTVAGRLAMTVAVVVDGCSWLLLGVAVGLAGGGTVSSGVSLAVLVAGLGTALLLRRLLAVRAPVRSPRTTAVALGAVTVAVAGALEHWGLSGVIGAVLVGVTIPAGGSRSAKVWSEVVRRVGRAGSLLVPVFFLMAGMDVFAGPSTVMPWALFAVATVLAVAGKLGGGWLGARLGGQPQRTAITVGVLLNTRGLTEIVVLQAGYSAGILTAPMFLALVAMALVTTVATGPLLRLLRRGDIEPALAVPQPPGGRMPPHR